MHTYHHLLSKLSRHRIAVLCAVGGIAAGITIGSLTSSARHIRLLLVQRQAVVSSPFPPFAYTMYPVSRVPNWGAMRTPEQWERMYSAIPRDEFMPLPRYDLTTLTIPLRSLMASLDASQTIAILTAKLTYSTRFFGAYDLDSGEFTDNHPGIDVKLPIATPVRAIAGGRVDSVRRSEELGLHVLIEHRPPYGGAFVSIYGHLGSSRVASGDDTEPGEVIGTVGMTGNSSSPHLHLQVDRGDPGREHQPYLPSSMPSREEAERYTVHPIEFIERYRNATP